MKNVLNNKSTIGLISILIMFVVLFNILSGINFMKILSIFFILVCLILLIRINIYHKDISIRIDKYKLLAISFLVLTYLPILTNGFYFHDDYINFMGHNINFFNFSLTQARPITGLFTDLMSFITVNNSYFLRWISILGLIFYLISLYNIIFKLTRNQLGAFCISLVLSTIIPIINVVSYGSMFIYSWSFVFALISVQYYMEAIKGLGNKNYKHLIKGLVATSILIICSNLIYQATSTVAFLGLTLYIIFNKEKLDYIGRYKNYIYYIGYIVIFISSTGIYYIGYRLTMRYFQIYLMQRGDIIFSIKELIEKIQWLMLE